MMELDRHNSSCEAYCSGPELALNSEERKTSLLTFVRRVVARLGGDLLCVGIPFGVFRPICNLLSFHDK